MTIAEIEAACDSAELRDFSPHELDGTELSRKLVREGR